MSEDTRSRTEATDPPESRSPATSSVNRPVFIGSGVAIVAIAVWAMLAREQATEVLGEVVVWVSEWFGWFYVLLATSVLVFVLFIALSRYGRTKLGPEHSKPEFGTFSWVAMLFAAGIGTDLMFFAVAEPVTQYLAPPSVTPESVEAAREANVWTLFHYGISGWGMYALMGMALGYFAYRLNLPLAVRSALYPLFGRRVEGALGHGVDMAAIVGTIFGVATTLGIAVVQLNFGLNQLVGLPMSIGWQVALIALGVAMATASAVSGVDRGIKWLSQANVILAIGLALWILVTGRTSFLLNGLVLNIGDFVNKFPGMMLQTFAFEDNAEWMSAWTLFFWAWWIAWASFVGLFLARISRGRTIRQFVAGTLIIPFLYILMWVSIFGNASIDLIRQGNQAFGELALNTPEQGFYTLLAEYPWFPFVASLATFTALLFYVTSADSGALVMANLSSRLSDVRADGSPPLRIFWATVTGALTIALLAMDGIPTLQAATVIMGLPFAFVMILVMIGLYRALRVERYLEDSRAGTMRGSLSGRSNVEPRRPTPWQARVHRMTTFPTVAAAEDYLRNTALPVLQEVAAELQGKGVPSRAESIRDEDGKAGVELVAEDHPEQPFCYRITQRERPIPAFGWAPEGTDYYYRLEVHLRLGGQGYDVMGYSHAQLVDDVLDQYESHLEFLHLLQDGEGN